MELVRASFTDKELFRLREEFNDVDADRSGYIDNDELKILLTILNDSKVPSEDEVRRVMASADQSGDGQLDFLEFLALVKSLREERKADKSLVKSVKKFLDTVKTDLLGGIMKDVDDYKVRAYRYFNADKIAKQEKREAERMRIKAEAEAKKAQEEEDRRILAEEEAMIEAKVAERDEETGLETEILFDGNDIDYPDETDVVTIHIKILIFDPDKEESTCEVIENSRKRRQPFKFKCDGGAVIPGLALSIPKMSLGMKARIICPPQFAYGEKGLPPKVPPNTTLLIEVELLSFETLEGDPEEFKEIDMST
jgi:FK506-binding protein 1